MKRETVDAPASRGSGIGKFFFMKFDAYLMIICFISLNKTLKIQMDYFRGKYDEILYIHLSLSFARPVLLITMDPGLSHVPRGLDCRNH